VNTFAAGASPGLPSFAPASTQATIFSFSPGASDKSFVNFPYFGSGVQGGILPSSTARESPSPRDEHPHMSAAAWERPRPGDGTPGSGLEDRLNILVKCGVASAAAANAVTGHKAARM